MNRIYKLSAIALLASSTSLMAQSKSFQGASIGVFGAIAGAEVEGSANTTSGTSGQTATSGSGSIGKVTPVAGLDLSYGFEAGPTSVIGLGVSYIPLKAEIGVGSSGDSSSGGSINAKLKDHVSIYLQPTFVLNKDSAVFLKLNYSTADLKASGLNASVTSGDIEGLGGGIGLKTFLTPQAFIQVEANYTEYDNVKGTKTNSNGRITTVEGDPKIAQGIITLGYKF
jgi:opacity protein-like surface antigen